jgi:DNA-binding helix-hairpin-helix protein with protein kinase domain
MFQPPELHGAALNRVVRTANHDAFGLAVTIFQLLMQGRHPYAGRYSGPGDMPIEKAIVEHRFAYSSTAATTGMSKPPNSVGLDVLPGPVAGLFEHAFSASAARTARPPAASWVTLLEALRANLSACRTNRTHHYSRHLSSCPWCALESQSGALLFGVPQTASTRAAEDERDKLARRLNALAPPRPLPAPAAPVTRPAPSVAASQAAGIPAGAWAGYGVAAVLVLAGVPLLPAGLLLMLLGAVGAALAQNAVHRRRKPFRSALRAAEEAHTKIADEFAAANAFPGYHAARARAQGAMAQLDGLPAVRAAGMSQLLANRHSEQLGALLSSRLIENARISGIGAGRAATLAAYGITTAADVSRYAITQIPGFGQVMADRLAGWRYDLEKNFVFDPAKPVAPAAIAKLDKEIADTQAQALRELRDALHRMEAAIRDEPTRAEAAAVRLRSVQQRLARAQSDVAAATGQAVGAA